MRRGKEVIDKIVSSVLCPKKVASKQPTCIMPPAHFSIFIGGREATGKDWCEPRHAAYHGVEASEWELG